MGPGTTPMRLAVVPLKRSEPDRPTAAGTLRASSATTFSTKRRLAAATSRSSSP